jgi:tellurite resistance protein TerC
MIYLFITITILALIIDLKFAMTKENKTSIKEPLLWTVFWILISIAFGGIVYHQQGAELAIQFFTAYVVEKSLSIDNLFVFIIILNGSKLTHTQERSVLFYGIVGAIVMRGIFIWAGIGLVHHFSWIFYIFGAMLIHMGIKMFHHEEAQTFKLSPKLKLKPFGAAILLVIWADLIFAIDSIPAVIAITEDTFIAYTSNIFAILGLRSLFFVLKNTSNKLSLIRFAIGIITIFVGIKMLINPIYHIPSLWSCLFIFSVLLCGVGASLYHAKRQEKKY